MSVQVKRLQLVVACKPGSGYDFFIALFREKFSHLNFIGCSEGPGHTCALYLQFTKCVRTATLEKFLKLKSISLLRSSSYIEPRYLQCSWGTFHSKGREVVDNKSPVLPPVSESDTVQDLKRQIEELSKENRQLKASGTVVNNTVNSHNINSNNHVQIVINNFGSETLSHISPEQLESIVTPFLQGGCESMVSEKYFDLTAQWGEAVYSNPLNRNIKCRRKDAQTQVYVNGQWKTFPRREKTKEAFNNLKSTLRTHGENLCNDDLLQNAQVGIYCMCAEGDEELNSFQYDKKKDAAICDIMYKSRQKV